MADEYILIGKTKKTHGTNGELKVFIEDRFLDDFAETDVVFITIQGKPAPFFIEEIRVAGDLLLKLEDIDTPAQAKTITSSDIFMRRQDLANPEEELPLSDFGIFEGYEMEDEHLGMLGRIVEVAEYPHQQMAIVDYNGSEVLIPLHMDLIREIDKKAGLLRVSLPDGMLDL